MAALKTDNAAVTEVNDLVKNNTLIINEPGSSNAFKVIPASFRVSNTDGESPKDGKHIQSYIVLPYSTHA